MREHLAAFRRCGADVIPVRLADELATVDALAIPGGESTTMGRLLRVFDLEDPLRRRLRENLPTFTTCAGLILLSRRILDGRVDQPALGTLDITVRRNAYGSQRDSFESDLDVAGLDGPPFRGVFIRAPQVVEVGADVEVLAEEDGSPVAIAQGVHLGVTFHPEMTGDDRLHRHFLDRVVERRTASAA